MSTLAGSSGSQQPSRPPQRDDSRIVYAGLMLTGLGVAAVVALSLAAQDVSSAVVAGIAATSGMVTTTVGMLAVYLRRPRD